MGLATLWIAVAGGSINVVQHVGSPGDEVDLTGSQDNAEKHSLGDRQPQRCQSISARHMASLIVVDTGSHPIFNVMNVES